MAKGKFGYWLPPDCLPCLEAYAREVVDIQVENALLKCSIGYVYTEVTKESSVIPCCDSCNAAVPMLGRII